METNQKKPQTTVHAMVTEVLSKIAELEKSIGMLRTENSMLHNRVVHMSRLLEDRQGYSQQFYPNQQSSYPETKFNNYIPPAYQPYPGHIQNTRTKLSQNHHFPSQQRFFTGQHSFARLDITVIAEMLLADNPGLALHDFEIEINDNRDELYIILDPKSGGSQSPQSSGKKLLRFMSLMQDVDFHNLTLYVVQKNVIHAGKGLLITTYLSLLGVLVYGVQAQFGKVNDYRQYAGRY